MDQQVLGAIDRARDPPTMSPSAGNSFSVPATSLERVGKGCLNSELWATAKWLHSRTPRVIFQQWLQGKQPQETALVRKPWAGRKDTPWGVWAKGHRSSPHSYRSGQPELLWIWESCHWHLILIPLPADACTQCGHEVWRLRYQCEQGHALT